MKISVITVCYNSVDTIEKTILSVLNQTYIDIEYIVIDGGSMDGTVDIIKKYNDNISYWVSEPDKGIYDAMNKGIAVATGDYINFMNSGDKFFNDKTIESIFTKIYHDEDVIYGETLKISDYCSYIEQCMPLEKMRHILPFGHQATFVKTTTIRDNLFDLHYKSASDYNQFFQIWKKGGKFIYVPQIVAIFDARDGFSALNIPIVLKEIAEINGTIREEKWHTKYKKLIFVWKIKKWIKKLLPRSIIRKLNIGNLKRIPGRTIYEIF